MKAPLRISRYLLDDCVRTAEQDEGASLWHGRDEVLDREVSVRLLDADDPRAPAFVGAARAAALVDDRRLLRILDVLEVAAHDDEPARIAVVSEWVRGQSLEQLMRARDWAPVPDEQAIAIVDDVARAIAAGIDRNVGHGRLRAASVIVTDAQEIRVRGLAVDAALWGPLAPGLTPERADVDGLGSLLMLLSTGTWPGPDAGESLPASPRAGDRILPPSQIVAGVPRAIDDLVARSVHDAARPRGTTNLPDVPAFVTALGVVRDHRSAPGAVGAAIPLTPARRISRGAGRLIVSLLALALAVAVGVVGWQIVTGGPSAWQPSTEDASAVLTASAAPEPSSAGIEQVVPIVAVQSFDPFGDDNKNGKADGRKGRENEEEAALAADGTLATTWTSDRYRSADLDGKGGVGLVLDLGRSIPVRAVTLDFDGAGTDTEVRVADRIYRDPGTWNLLTSAPAGGAKISLRAARPIVGRYVLLWFPRAPEVAAKPGTYRVAVRDVAVTGLP
jgi:hypothetical protein